MHELEGEGGWKPKAYHKYYSLLVLVTKERLNMLLKLKLWQLSVYLFCYYSPKLAVAGWTFYTFRFDMFFFFFLTYLVSLHILVRFVCVIVYVLCRGLRDTVVHMLTYPLAKKYFIECML